MFPPGDLDDTVTVSIVTGRGVADAQSLGFGGVTVGCLRYDLGREGWTILENVGFLNRSEARKCKVWQKQIDNKGVTKVSKVQFADVSFSYKNGIMFE